MSDEVKAAAERLRLHRKAIEIHDIKKSPYYPPNDCHVPAQDQVIEEDDLACDWQELANAYLAEHPADEDGTIHSQPVARDVRRPVGQNLKETTMTDTVTMEEALTAAKSWSDRCDRLTADLAAATQKAELADNTARTACERHAEIKAELAEAVRLFGNVPRPDSYYFHNSSKKCTCTTCKLYDDQIVFLTRAGVH
jgi:hypothetical protein